MEYGLIGKTLNHSYSKLIHSYIGDYLYELKELDEKDLESFILNKDFKAINVTIPYKEKVVKYLDVIDESCSSINAINLIVNKKNKLVGYNTDYYGLIDLINKSSIDIKNKRVLILGTGGTSKTAYNVCLFLKAKEIVFVSSSSKEGAISYETALKDYLDFEIIINTTPVGMNGEDEIIDISLFHSLKGVIDVIYNPINTPLINKAKERGISCIGGLYMLISQAVKAASIFLEKEFDNSFIESIYNKVLFDKQNIVLIGMPTCGKTSIGKLLSVSLNKDFIDVDEEIIKVIDKPIHEFLSKNNENEFRKIESEVILSLKNKRGCVIALGGGSILNKINVDLLKSNGLLIFIDRDLSLLKISHDRPLSSSKEKMKELYNKRYDLYKKYADIIVSNNTSLENVLDNILEVIK